MHLDPSIAVDRKKDPSIVIINHANFFLSDITSSLKSNKMLKKTNLTRLW